MSVDPPRDAAGDIVCCSACGKPLRVVSMTNAGVQFKCECNATSWTRMTEGVRLSDLTRGEPQEGDS